MKIKISKRNQMHMLEILIAIEAVLSINPYLLWETYNFYRIFDILKMILELVIVFLFLFQKKIEYEKQAFVCCITFVVVYVYYSLNNYNNVLNIGLGTIMKLILLLIFLSLSEKSKGQVFRYFLYLFAISLIPGIFVSLMNILGVNIKYNIIQPVQEIKIAANLQYKHYFLAVFRENRYWSPRFKPLCGLYDEPGMIGTVSALLLCADNFNVKKYKENIVLIIGGIMSMSLAFFIVCFFYYMFYLFNIKKKKQIYIILAIVLSVCVVLFIFRDNEILQDRIFNRITWTSLINNNRTSDEFDIIFRKYLQSGEILFGLGNGNPIFNIVDAASYKVLIYNIGIIGFMVLVGWFGFWGIYRAKGNKYANILVGIFLLSIYQRPWIIYMYMLVILFGGIANQKLQNKTKII